METLYTARTHPKVLFKPFAIQLFLLFIHVLIYMYIETDISWVEESLHGVIIILEIWYVVVPLLQWWNNIFIVTDDRIINKWGVLYKHSREIRFERIASISEERGILDRIFGSGTINFYDASADSQPRTSGSWNKRKSHDGIQFKDIPRVKYVREMINRIIKRK